MVREATQDDLPQVLELCRAFFLSSDWARDATFDDGVVFASLWDMLSTTTAHLLVIERGGVVVGGCGAQIQQIMFSIETQATELFWFVMPEARHSPESLELFVCMETWAREAGVQYMTMGALVTTPPKVRDLYLRAGYRESQTTFIKRLC